MRGLTSYHNHTTWSDGRCSIQDHLAYAVSVQLDEIGISDHFSVAPQGLVVDWSMPLDSVQQYLAEMREAAASSQIPLRVGLEVDYFPETVDEIRRRLAPLELDFVIGSVHYADLFPIDESADLYAPLSEEELNAVWRRYWHLIAEMAETGLYDWVGHIDLPKKFGFRPTESIQQAVEHALEAVKSADMAIEINTAGWSLPAAEAYPSTEILSMAFRMGIPLLINADAHRAEHLDKHFARAVELARSAGYTELVRFCGRRRSVVPLPA